MPFHEQNYIIILYFTCDLYYLNKENMVFTLPFEWMNLPYLPKPLGGTLYGKYLHAISMVGGPTLPQYFRSVSYLRVYYKYYILNEYHHETTQGLTLLFLEHK
jgi:hypothetical protein